VPTRLPDDAQGHIDTSCLFLARPAFELLGFWERYPRHLSVLGDRVFVRALRARGFVPACSGALTTRYTIRDPAVYAAMGVPVTAGARAPIEFSPLFRWYGSLGDEARAGLDALLGFAVACCASSTRTWRRICAYDAEATRAAPPRHGLPLRSSYRVPGGERRGTVVGLHASARSPPRRRRPQAHALCAAVLGRCARHPER